MSEPKRWLAGLDDAPPGASLLLSAYSTAAPMPPDVHARLLAKAAKLSALKPMGMAALLASKPAAATIAVAIAGASAVATIAPGPAPVVEAPLVTTLAPVARVARVTHRKPENRPIEAIVPLERLALEPPVPRPSPSKAVTPSAASLVEELDLVDRARAALETDPATTWRLCEEHARRYPSGQLGSAREALSMRALRKLGRTAEARQHAKTLLNRDPETLHAEEASKLIEEK
jgi:hypothetical protein